ncbi:hypothetical protein GGE12_006448 [Rhizobium mongolense]|uniref:Uncharacterized protein n=1 Tax=Rhizobium mongolense TaxID=57676 RepID=A0A7W6RU12_9HYPH|nr:hypothetical protein [Rhizobium mongolense]
MHFGCETLEGEGTFVVCLQTRAHLPGIVEAVGGVDEKTVRTAHEPCG